MKIPGISNRLERAVGEVAESYGKVATEDTINDPALETLRYILGKGKSAGQQAARQAEEKLARAVENSIVDAVGQAIA
jgi:hypothetical protein